MNPGPSQSYTDSAATSAGPHLPISLHRSSRSPFHFSFWERSSATVLAPIRGYNTPTCSYCGHLLPAINGKHPKSQRAGRKSVQRSLPLKTFTSVRPFSPNTTSYKATLGHDLFLFLSAPVLLNTIFSAQYFERKSHLLGQI